MQSTPTNRSQLVVWHLTDSALPTGGFAHSAGMETYLQRDVIRDADTFATWLRGYLYQATFNDALAARFAIELQQSGLSEAERVEKLAELARDFLELVQRRCFISRESDDHLRFLARLDGAHSLNVQPACVCDGADERSQFFDFRKCHENHSTVGPVQSST